MALIKIFIIIIPLETKMDIIKTNYLINRCQIHDT